MRKRILKRINQMMPGKLIRRQQFIKRINDKRRHTSSFSQYSFTKAPKSSRFNRWNDYKRFSNRSY